MFNNLCVTKYQCLAYLIHIENNTINCDFTIRRHQEYFMILKFNYTIKVSFDSFCLNKILSCH